MNNFEFLTRSVFFHRSITQCVLIDKIEKYIYIVKESENDVTERGYISVPYDTWESVSFDFWRMDSNAELMVDKEKRIQGIKKTPLWFREMYLEACAVQKRRNRLRVIFQNG